MRQAIAWTLFSLVATGAHGTGPDFTTDVTTATTNPNFILEDTDGEDWALEADAPLSDAFAIGYDAGAVHPFVIRNGAPANSLHIDASGEIGVGTSTPVGDLNITDINNSGASGIRFVETLGTPQTWDITASSSGFGIVDASNSSTRVALGVSSSDLLDPTGATFLSVAATGVTLSGSLIQLSSRNAKTDIQPVESREVLDKVLDLPLAHWRYKTEAAGVRHLGPMAEDFHSIFGLGSDSTGIPILDAGSIALAAIQGLQAAHEERLRNLEEEKDRQIDELRKELEELKRLVLGGRVAPGAV